MTKNDQLLTAKIISDISDSPGSSPGAQVETMDHIFATHCIEAGGISDRVHVEMNLHGDLTSVTIFPPDLEFDSNGWVHTSEVLSKLVSDLTTRVERINLSIIINLVSALEQVSILQGEKIGEPL